MLGVVIRALALGLACASVAAGGDGTVVMELVPRQCDVPYRPQPTPYFQPTQIILAKGSLDTPPLYLRHPQLSVISLPE